MSGPMRGAENPVFIEGDIENAILLGKVHLAFLTLYGGTIKRLKTIGRQDFQGINTKKEGLRIRKKKKGGRVSLLMKGESGVREYLDLNFMR